MNDEVAEYVAVSKTTARKAGRLGSQAAGNGDANTTRTTATEFDSAIAVDATTKRRQRQRNQRGRTTEEQRTGPDFGRPTTTIDATTSIDSTSLFDRTPTTTIVVFATDVSR